MLKLYYSRASCAYAPHILLYDQQNFRPSILIFQRMSRMHRILRLNPKRVPALQTADGIITENPAILFYIAQPFPEKGLAPRNSFDLAMAQAFNMAAPSTSMSPYAHKHRGYRWAETVAAHEMTEKVPENMASCAAMIQDHFFKGPFVLGREYSICIRIWHWSRDGSLLTGFRWMISVLKEHHEMMLQRPSLKRISPYINTSMIECFVVNMPPDLNICLCPISAQKMIRDSAVWVTSIDNRSASRFNVTKKTAKTMPMASTSGML